MTASSKPLVDRRLLTGVLGALSLLAPMLFVQGCKCGGAPADRNASPPTGEPLTLATIDSAAPSAAAPADAAPGAKEGPALAGSREISDAGLRRGDGGGGASAQDKELAAKREKEKLAREAACDNVLRDIAGARAASSADLMALGYKDRSRFDLQVIGENPIVECHAVRLGNEAACRLYPNLEKRDKCISEVDYFRLARRAPADTAWRFPDSQMSDCLRIPKMNAAECARLRDAIRSGKPEACPSVDPDVHSLCAAIATNDASKCPAKRFSGCANDMKRQVLIAKGGLQSLVDNNAPEKTLAAAALGSADACDELGKAWKAICVANVDVPAAKKAPAPTPAAR